MRLYTRSTIAAAVLIVTSSLLTLILKRASAASDTLLRYHWVRGLHFVQSQVEIVTTIFQINPATLGLSRTDVTIDRLTTTTSVAQVFPDGSGLLRLTYSDVSITSNDQTKRYPATGYAEELRVGSTGTLISKRTIGQAPLQGFGDHSGPERVSYPQVPTRMGSTWTEAEPVFGFGTTVLHVRIVALGTLAGRPTLTMQMAASLPMRIGAGPLVVTGTGKMSSTTTVFVDTGAPASAASSHASFHGTLSGTIQGIKLRGTMSMTEIGNITPLK
jgi:hypothetical protein